MTNSLIDSDVYIDFLQSGRFHTENARLYAAQTPGIHFSSVVIEELLAGATSPNEQKNVGATVYTRNRADFQLLQRFRHFSLVVLE